MLRSDLVLLEGAVRVEPGTLSLAELHGVRALATRLGWLEEAAVDITCRNCGERIEVEPCSLLQLGPFVDAELDDPELDVLLDLEQAHEVEGLGEVRLRPVTAKEALPLHAALTARRLRVTADVVVAMGLAALGAEREPAAIARILQRCGDDAFADVCRLFHQAHYTQRLFALVLCPKCGARNDVDAPYDREFQWVLAEHAAHPEKGFPSLSEFDAMARRIAEPLMAKAHGPPVRLVVDGEVPAVDDGGEPLLGSYVPPPAMDGLTPTRPPMVTLYYRTFEAIERDEGRYDWEGELRETIEHELEHHVYFLRGDDPMDAEERDEIAREAVRVIGRKEATRRTLAVFGESGRDFFTRAWPLVLIGALVLLITIAESRCAP